MLHPISRDECPDLGVRPTPNRKQRRKAARQAAQNTQIRTVREHPLLTLHFNGIGTLVAGFWGIGVALMAISDSFPIFLLGLLFALGGISGSIWLFAGEWRQLLRDHVICSLPVDFKVAAVMTVGALVGLCLIAWQFWPISAPLVLTAEVGPGNYLPNEPMGDISWRPIYASLRIGLENNTSYDYDNPHFDIHTELPISEMTVESAGDADCRFRPAEDLSKMGHIGNMVAPQFPPLRALGKDGRWYQIPLPEIGSWPKHLIAPDTKYRASCDKIPSQTALVFLAAIINPGPPGTGMASPRPPHWVSIKAQYEVSGRLYVKKQKFDCPTDECVKRQSWWRKHLPS